jgi:hypothetical protein
MLQRFWNWWVGELDDHDWQDWPIEWTGRPDVSSPPFKLPPDIEPSSLSDSQKATIRFIAKRVTAQEGAKS